MAWLLSGLALVLQPFAAVAASASSWAELLAGPSAAAAMVAGSDRLGQAAPARGQLLRVVQFEAGGFVVFSLVEGKLVSRYFGGQREKRM